MTYLPSAYWDQLGARAQAAEALVRDLNDMTHPAAKRRQLGRMEKARHHVRQALQILSEMRADVAVEDVERDLKARDAVAIGGKP